MLQRLNPFRRLDRPKEVWAWGMYDLANQSFQLIINTLIFSQFVQQVVVVDDPARGNRLWSTMVAASLLLIVVVSPVVGAVADHKAWKREILLVTGVVCAIVTASLGIIQPGQAALAFGLYLVAALACGLGENFLGSFLPEISTPRNVGYISALGWTMSYVGAILLLAITGAYAFIFEKEDPSEARPLFVISGVWFALGILPAMVFLRERAKPHRAPTATVVGEAFRRLAHTARETRRFRHLARFFLAFFVYSMGTLTMIYFLGIIANTLGFGLGESIVLALVIALTAGIAAAIVARYQDRLGHRRTVAIFLITWIVATLAIAAARWVQMPPGAYWFVAGMIGVGLGGIGTASRAMVGAFTPPARAGEFFGLWGTIYRLSGIAGVLCFGQLSAIMGLAPALLVVAGFFAIGLLLLQRVDEAAGIAAAHDPANGSPPPA